MNALSRIRPEIRGWLELDTWRVEELELGPLERESELVKLGGFRVQIEPRAGLDGEKPGRE